MGLNAFEYVLLIRHETMWCYTNTIHNIRNKCVVMTYAYQNLKLYVFVVSFPLHSVLSTIVINTTDSLKAIVYVTIVFDAKQ